MITAAAASVFVETFLASWARLPPGDRPALLAGAVDWQRAAAVALGEGWAELTAAQRAEVAAAYRGYAVPRLAALPLDGAAVVAAGGHHGEALVTARALDGGEPAEITFFLPDRAGGPPRIGNIGVGGVPFAGREGARWRDVVAAHGVGGLLAALRERAGRPPAGPWW
jgi:ABC-type transporter MlaC component